MSTTSNTASHAPSGTGIKPQAGFWFTLALIVFVAIVACALAASIFPTNEVGLSQLVGP